MGQVKPLGMGSVNTGIAPMLGGNVSEPVMLLIFSVIFFALVMIFSLRPAKITVWIGKIINPLFLIFLAVLVIAALLNSGAAVSVVEPTEAYKTAPLFSAVIEGYGTMDAIAGLAFGIVVIDIIRSMGVEEDSAIAKDVLLSGIMTGVLMAVIYIATILMGHSPEVYLKFQRMEGLHWRRFQAIIWEQREILFWHLRLRWPV